MKKNYLLCAFTALMLIIVVAGTVYSDELSERRAAAKVLPPLMNSTNVYWDGSTLHVEFEVLTYSPQDDLRFHIFLSDENLNTVESRTVPDEAVSHSGYGRFVLYLGGVQQNKLKISFDIDDLTQSDIDALTPDMYFRVFVCNDDIQDELGTINGYDWPDSHFTLYIPKIIDSNMNSYNSPYDQSDQDYAQRYIKVSSNSNRNRIVDFNTTIDPVSTNRSNRSSDDELSERRAAAKVLPPLMNSTNVYWDGSTLHVEFEVLTYSPQDDLRFHIFLSDENLNTVESRTVPDEAVSHSGYGRFVLYLGGVQQNKLKISFDIDDLTQSDIDSLTPDMYFRVFVCNDDIQNELGTINGYDWPDSHFTLYIPKIIDDNMNSYNSPYDQSDQDYAQRYIKVSSISSISSNSHQKILLLLHGMNSDPITWNDLVQNRFNNHAINIYDGAYSSFEQQVPDEKGVLCFRLDFGSFDAISGRRDLKGKLATGDSSGDFSTFEQLGEEVKDAVSAILDEFANAEIVIVGHSRGGLAARSFLQEPVSSYMKASVVAVLTTGTPHHGSRLGRVYNYLDTCNNCDEDWQVAEFLSGDREPVNWRCRVDEDKRLDVCRPTIEDLRDPEDLADNSTAIENLNESINNLPTDIAYGSITYQGVDLGILVTQEVPFGNDDYSIFQRGGIDWCDQLSDQAEISILGTDQDASLFSGDGIVPENSQRYSNIEGFPSMVLPISDEFINMNVKHIEEPGRDDDIFNSLNVLVDWWSN
jgi:PGAP1-like protein